MKNYRWFVIMALAGLCLDQGSKWLVSTGMSLHQSIELLPNFFHLTYLRNPGAAFGILANHAFRLPFFISISILASLGILWYLWKQQGGSLRQQLALGLILSGALGNLIDRIRYGEVVDFLDVHWYHHHWPAFNVADSAICVGVGLLLLDSWFEERRKSLKGKEDS